MTKIVTFKTQGDTNTTCTGSDAQTLFQYNCMYNYSSWNTSWVQISQRSSLKNPTYSYVVHNEWNVKDAWEQWCVTRDLPTVQLVMPIDNIGTFSKIYALSILFDFCWSSASLAVRLLHVIIPTCMHNTIISSCVIPASTSSSMWCQRHQSHRRQVVQGGSWTLSLIRTVGPDRRALQCRPSCGPPAHTRLQPRLEWKQTQQL